MPPTAAVEHLSEGLDHESDRLKVRRLRSPVMELGVIRSGPLRLVPPWTAYQDVRIAAGQPVQDVQCHVLGDVLGTLIPEDEPYSLA